MTYTWEGWVCKACGKTWSRYSQLVPWWKRLFSRTPSRRWPDMQGQWHRVEQGGVLRDLCGPIRPLGRRRSYTEAA